jgi:phosphopantothenoylcysteine decarboxylase / phosphopantothenate---cysteine ligase
MSQAILKDKLVLITAGPTKEAIDPVRFISNHSSGKMGYAIAEEFLKQGAKVVLVSGPVNLSLSHPNLTLISVTSANEMYQACCHFFETCDIAVFSAAVADYRPKLVAKEKIKKDDACFVIEMVKNIDIATEFGRHKQAYQIAVGFALETNDEYNHAIGKLHRKNFDMVVLNSMNDAGATFGHDTNKISIISKALKRMDFPLKSKAGVAKDIVRSISELVMVNEPFEELIKVA